MRSIKICWHFWWLKTYPSQEMSILRTVFNDWVIFVNIFALISGLFELNIKLFLLFTEYLCWTSKYVHLPSSLTANSYFDWWSWSQCFEITERFTECYYLSFRCIFLVFPFMKDVRFVALLLLILIELLTVFWFR